MIQRLWQQLTKRRRKQFLLILTLMIFASLLEIVSIAAVVPFLAALTAPERVFQHQFTQPLIQIFDITGPSQLLLPLTVAFVIATLIAATVRLLLLFVSTRFSYAVGADLSVNIYRRTLYQDYSIHTSRNSSEIINSIITKTNTVIIGIVAPTLMLVSSVVIMLGIISIVFTINARVALLTFSIFAVLYSIIAFLTKKSIEKNSKLIAGQSTQMVKSLQEGLGGIRDVLIDGTQEFYCKIYQNADLSLRKASGDNVFIGASPRYLMEAIGMILIAILAYFLTVQKGGVLEAIPILGALALAAQKLLPALQHAYASYSSIKGSKASFVDVLNLLEQPLPLSVGLDLIGPVVYEQNIVFKDLSFRYSKDTPWILKNVNLRFKKGEKIGFIGATGSGKSTLLDILMGLLSPTLGELLIDGVVINQQNRRQWQSRISHVPQSIYLADSTIYENIGFGVEVEKIREIEVIQAAEKAQIAEMVKGLENGYQTLVGEQGVRLSGGQRQRIGIARALYKNANILIFDEATSALDNETEQGVMDAISNLDKDTTVFIIAHRLSTLKKCDKIVKLDNEFNAVIVSYEEIIVE